MYADAKQSKSINRQQSISSKSISHLLINNYRSKQLKQKTLIQNMEVHRIFTYPIQKRINANAKCMYYCFVPQLHQFQNQGNNHWSIIFNKLLFDSNSPKDILSSYNKTDAENIQKIIKEPQKDKTLTRMHMVRGRFGGPGTPNNLRFGTSYSNLYSINGHYKAVEEPITEFIRHNINPKSDNIAIDYQINISDPSVPSYLTERNDEINKDPQIHNKVKKFLELWCPSEISCNVTFYRRYNEDGWKQSNTQNQRVKMDLTE